MKSIVIKIMLIACLVCFVLPFVTVSCQLDDQGHTASGFEIAAGKFTDDTLNQSQSAKPNLFLIFSILLIVVALIWAWVAKRFPSVGIGVLSLLSVLCFIGVALIFKKYYGFSEEQLELLSFRFRYGFYVTAGLHAVTGILSFLVPREGSPEDDFDEWAEGEDDTAGDEDTEASDTQE